MVYDGRARIDYRQVLVRSSEADTQFDAAFAGQVNGLLGAGVAGALILIAGTHTGNVGLQIVLHDEPPPTDGHWEDVVEASFRPAGIEISVDGLMGDHVCSFRLPNSSNTYRARWSGMGIDSAYDGVVGPDDPLVDVFQLALWPAAAAPDAIIRQASRRGREAHLARTPEGRAQLELDSWGGRLPSEALRRRRAHSMVQLDRELAERLAAASPVTLQAVTRRLVRYVCVELGIAQLPWVASALDDVDAGRPLPETFNPGTVYERLEAEPTVHNPDERDELTGEAGAGWGLFMILRAADELLDPLDAALETVPSACVAFGARRNAEVLDQVRAELDA